RVTQRSRRISFPLRSSASSAVSKSGGQPMTRTPSLSRRDCLKVGTAGLLGLTLPDVLRWEARAAEAGRKPRAHSVILVWLAGGPSHLDMWDPKPDAPEGIRGTFKPIPTKATGVRISEHLPKTADVADKISVVRSLNHTIPSHAPATIFMTT